jgi:hypothetical protein
MRHGAVRIVFGDVEEFLFGFFVPERVQKGDSARKGFLHGRGAGNGEVDRAQLSLGEIFVMMMVFVLVVIGKNDGAAQARKKQQPGKTFHGKPR